MELNAATPNSPGSLDGHRYCRDQRSIDFFVEPPLEKPLDESSKYLQQDSVPPHSSHIDVTISAPIDSVV